MKFKKGNTLVGSPMAGDHLPGAGAKAQSAAQALHFHLDGLEKDGSTRISIPAPGTENDHNPPRIAVRHLFDMAVGHDNHVPWGPLYRVFN
jgi:hypothetical protein